MSALSSLGRADMARKKLIDADGRTMRPSGGREDSVLNIGKGGPPGALRRGSRHQLSSHPLQLPVLTPALTLPFYYRHIHMNFFVDQTSF